MPIELTFEGCVQDSQAYGSDDVCMVSRLFFWVKRQSPSRGDFSADLKRVAGNNFEKMRIDPPSDYTGPMAYADLRQPVGEDFESTPIEVGRPAGYSGAINQAEFAKHAVAYFRGLTSESGAMMRVEDGRLLRGGTRPTGHIRMSHNVRAKRRTVRLETNSA